MSTQTPSNVEVSVNYETPPVLAAALKTETLSYSIGIQTTEPWFLPKRRGSTDGFSDSDREESPAISRSPKSLKRLSRRERDREDELRRNLRREIEEELNAVKDPTSHLSNGQTKPQKLPTKALTNEDIKAVTSADDFADFLERSSKVIERALDEEYDILTNYALDDLNGLADDEDEGYGSSKGKRGRRLKEIAQFFDERWSKRRMISDINFSPKVCILVDDSNNLLTHSLVS